MREIALAVLGAGLVSALPAFGVARQRGAIGVLALATGSAVALALLLSWGVERLVLAPLALSSLRTFGVVMAMATALLSISLLTARRAPEAHRLLGALLPMSMAACGLLAIAAVDIAERTLPGILAMAAGCGAAVAAALLLFAALRERSDAADVPPAWRGAPIALLNAALVALALVGVAGLDAG